LSAQIIKAMKKNLFIFILLVASQIVAYSQTVEITPFGGYVFPARWNTTNGSLRFNGNAQYGGMISVGISPSMDVDLIYNRIDTKGVPEIAGYSGDEIPLSQNYFMVGATKNFRINSTVSPFVGFNLGAAYFAPKTTEYYSYWFFAMGVDGGVKVYFNKYFGLRLQAQMLIPIQGGGFTFYYGTGGGGSSVYVTSTLVDFGFTGGLIFRLGK